MRPVCFKRAVHLSPLHSFGRSFTQGTLQTRDATAQDSLRQLSVRANRDGDVSTHQLLSFLQLCHCCGELDGRLPPDGEAEADETVKGTPDVLGSYSVSVACISKAAQRCE